MITVMRRYFKGKALQIVAWLTILSVIGFWSGAGLVNRAGRARRGLDGWVAMVNGQEIGHRDYLQAVQMREHYITLIRNQFGEHAEQLLMLQGLTGDPRVRALQELVTNELLDGAAKQLKLNLQESYIDFKMSDPSAARGYLGQIVPFDVLNQQGVDQIALNNYLHRSGISGEHFNEMLSAAIGRDLVTQLVEATSYVPIVALHNRYQLDYAQKKFSILTVPFDPFLKKEKEKAVSDEDLKSFYEHESKNYMLPEARVARTWTFEPSNYNVTVSDQEVQNYYDEHKADKYIEKPEQIQIRRILFKISPQESEQSVFDQARKVMQETKQNPALFAQKAKELSADQESAKNGGLLPFFAKGSKEERLERVAFMLHEDNEIAEPFVDSEGIELIQRVSRKPAAYKPLTTVQNGIRELLSTRKFQELFVEDMRPIMDQVELNEQDLNAFIQKRGGIEKKITVDEADKSKLARVIFALNEKGINSFLDNGKGVAVQLLEIKKRALPSLDTMKTKVLDDLHQERAYKAFETSMNDLLCKAATQPLENIAKLVSGTVTSVDSFDPQDAKRMGELKKEQVPVDIMMQMETVGSVQLQLKPAKGMIVRLDKVQPFDEKSFEAKKAELAQKMERDETYLALQGFVASLYRNAKIETNNSLLEINEELAL